MLRGRAADADMSSTVSVLMVVEDEPDIQMLVRLQFRRDSRFKMDGAAATVEDAIALADQEQPDLIILDHKLAGVTTGLEGAPRLKAAASHAKIILFTASEELRVPAGVEPSVDAFLLKTRIADLVPLARELLELDSAAEA